jgi:hypothetical protein
MTGEFLTRSTIWITIVAYTAGSVMFALRRGSRSDSAVRLAWTIACVSLAAHFIAAFQFYHGWSHYAAYRDTARQTQEMIGVSWGGGLFINYGLLALWITDVGAWWFRGLDSYRRRSRTLIIAWHAFLIFIILNATVVFGHGAARGIGVVVCLILAGAWLRFVVSKEK